MVGKATATTAAQPQLRPPVLVAEYKAGLAALKLMSGELPLAFA
jgi:hypothetical protein